MVAQSMTLSAAQRARSWLMPHPHLSDHLHQQYTFSSYPLVQASQEPPRTRWPRGRSSAPLSTLVSRQALGQPVTLPLALVQPVTQLLAQLLAVPPAAPQVREADSSNSPASQCHGYAICLSAVRQVAKHAGVQGLDSVPQHLVCDRI